MASRKDSSLVPESRFPAQSEEGSLEVVVMGTAFREKTSRATSLIREPLVLPSGSPQKTKLGFFPHGIARAAASTRREG